VSIKHMNVKLKQSKHRVLFSILKGLLLKIMKPAITKILEQQIRNSFRDLDAFAYRIYLEQEKIEKQLKEKPRPRERSEHLQPLLRGHTEGAYGPQKAG